MQNTRNKGVDTRIKQQQLCCQDDCQKLGTVCSKHFLGIRFMLCENHADMIIRDLRKQMLESTDLQISILPHNINFCISEKALIENTKNSPWDNIKYRVKKDWNKVLGLHITYPVEDITYIFTNRAIERIDLPERYININEITSNIQNYLKENNINIEKDEFYNKEYVIKKNKDDFTVTIPIIIQKNNRILLKTVVINKSSINIKEQNNNKNGRKERKPCTTNAKNPKGGSTTL